MEFRQLNQIDAAVSALGLGCMGLSEFYGAPTERTKAIHLLHQAQEHGVNHFDTAEVYGNGRNEQLLAQAFTDRWDSVFLATKFGIKRDPDSGALLGLDGSPSNVRESCEKSLRRLAADRIDLYYLHRADPDTDIEDTVGAMADLVQAGKIAGIGLSEATADQIRKAHAVHPITALQTEYSIFSRDVEAEIMPVCQQLGIALVAYSPLGRGMLTGRYATASDRPTDADDFRATSQPRFSEDNYANNIALVKVIQKVAQEHDCAASQVALAWVLAQGEHVVAIPGTTKLDNLNINLGALSVGLSDSNLQELNALAGQVQGARY